jgi:NitT/TauT family transport system substrate-binding protein
MTITISRREVLAGLGGTAALATLSPAMAADLPVVRVGLLPIFACASHYAAEQQGYFTQEGIAVSTQIVQGGAAGITGLVGGSSDVIYANSISCLTALERGFNLRFIAEGAPIPVKAPDPGGLMIRKGENLKTGKDFEGKMLGINAKFDLQWLVMNTWVKKTGGDLSKINYREVPLPAMVDAVKTKQVDGALVLDPFMTIAGNDPAVERAAWPLSEAMPGMPTSFWATSSNVLDAKAAQVRAYQKAFLRGGQWINANLRNDAYNQLVAGYTKTDIKLITQMIASNQPMAVDVGAANRLVELMKQNELLKTDVDFRSKVLS